MSKLLLPFTPRYILLTIALSGTAKSAREAVSTQSHPREISPSEPPAAPTLPAPTRAAAPAATGNASPAPPEPVSATDSLGWRPFAAMMLTGLSLPLAYWSRTVVPIAFAKARASLPAPAHRLKSIRGELGA